MHQTGKCLLLFVDFEMCYFVFVCFDGFWMFLTAMSLQLEM